MSFEIVALLVASFGGFCALLAFLREHERARELRNALVRSERLRVPARKVPYFWEMVTTPAKPGDITEVTLRTVEGSFADSIFKDHIRIAIGEINEWMRANPGFLTPPPSPEPGAADSSPPGSG